MTDPAFTSGEPSAFTRWLRIYRVPLGITAAFVLVLGAFALTSGGERAEPAPTDAAGIVQTPDSPERSPCVTCEIGHECDPDSGECVRIERTPPACVEGSTFDEEAGFCVPEATRRPEPTEIPVQTLAPDATPRSTPPPEDGIRTPRPPRDPDVGQEPETPQPTQAGTGTDG